MTTQPHQLTVTIEDSSVLTVVSLVHAVTYEILLVQAYFRSTPCLNLIDLTMKSGHRMDLQSQKKLHRDFCRAISLFCGQLVNCD